MLKDKKKYNINDTMLVKSNFMHCIKRIRIMLPVVFEISFFLSRIRYDDITKFGLATMYSSDI